MLDCFNINIPFGIKGIYTALDFHWESDKTFGGERHDFWEIVTVLAGQVEVVEDTLEVSRLKVLVVEDMVVHHMYQEVVTI